MNYWLIFLTGLTTGGLSCLVVQGGLLAATIASREHTPGPHAQQPNFPHDFVPTLLFLSSKLVAYTLLGALLGWFGSLFQLSSSWQAVFQITAGLFMLGLGLHLLDIHPWFRYLVFQPPKFVGRLLRTSSRSQHFFAPALLGLFTVFIPCGVTQGMEVLAVSSGHPLSGALILASFTLGTSPLFLLIGYLTTIFSETFRARFFRLAAALVIFLALSTINSGLVLSGSRYSFTNWIWAFQEVFLPPVASAPTQTPVIQVLNTGYSPARITVRAQQPVNLTLVTTNNRSCTSVFTIPELNITRSLPSTGRTAVTFTPPRAGLINFSCGMGMYSGLIEAI